VSVKPIGQARSLVLAVSDMDASCAFYGETMGFRLQFRDGERWAQFDAGGLTIALAGNGEAPPGSIGISLKVLNLAQAVDALVLAGGGVTAPAARGPHEVRSTVTDPDGHLLHLYEPVAP
jgi:predicted enzyme related to lactoylglutathione lyase